MKKIVLASIAALGAASAFAGGSLQAQINALQNRVNALSAAKGGSSAMFVQTNAAVSHSMLDVQGGVGRELNLLKAKKSGHLGAGVTLGGFVEATALTDKISNAPSASVASNGFQQFSTHASNFTDSASSGTSETASQITLPRVELNVIANMNSWATGYMSFRDLNIDDSTNGNALNINRAYFVLGNLNKMPVYAFMGKNTLDFGSFATVNFSTAPLNRLLFEAAGNEVGFGFNNYGLNFTAAAVNGVGTGGVNDNTYTKESDDISNFTVNANYGMHTAGADWKVGAGYIDGSKRKAASGTEGTGAWDVNGQVGFGAFDVLAEYTSTAGKVHNENGNKLKAWDLGATYHFPMMGKTTKVNLDYSKARAQYSAKQWVLGVQQHTFKNVWMGVEYSQSKGTLNTSTAGATVYQGGEVQYGAPTSNTGVENSTLLFDVQGQF